MSKRKIININQELCNGCGNCIPNCPEGAIQLIDGKARLISDMFCDGLGACLGECPLGAITIEEREAEVYNEKAVMKNVVKQGANTIKAHLLHLLDHGEKEYYNQAIDFLNENNIDIPDIEDKTKYNPKSACGCPGSEIKDFSDKNSVNKYSDDDNRPSELKQWPIQLHLISPNAPYYRNNDVVLIADCAGYAIGDFHKDYMKDKAIAIACPKLDSGLDIYVDKIAKMIDEAKINTLTVIIMEVPCCGGLVGIAQKALSMSSRKIPIKLIKAGSQGNILEERWL